MSMSIYAHFHNDVHQNAIAADLLPNLRSKIVRPVLLIVSKQLAPLVETPTAITLLGERKKTTPY